MSKVPVKLRELVKQRLAAAAEEIFELLERTMREYEEELIYNYDKQRKLETVERGSLSGEGSEWSPEPPHIKEEQEEECSSQEALHNDITLELWKREDTAPPFAFEEEEEAPEAWTQPVHHNQTVDCPEPPPPVAPLGDHLLHHNQTLERQRRLMETLLQPSILLNTSENGPLSVQPSEWDPSLFQDAPPHCIKEFEMRGVSVKSEEEESSETWTQQVHYNKTDSPEPPVPVAPSEYALFHHNTEAHTDNPNKNQQKPPNLVKSHIFQGCSQVFPAISMLENHIRVHTGERPFTCAVCGKRFALKETLETHSLVHSGLKLFSCSVCGKRFALKTDLKRHMRVHTGEKPFSCSVCGKSFSLKGNMEQHKKIHSGLKPYTCTVCGKAFSQKSNLNYHLLVHTNLTAAQLVGNSTN